MHNFQPLPDSLYRSSLLAIVIGAGLAGACLDDAPTGLTGPPSEAGQGSSAGSGSAPAQGGTTAPGSAGQGDAGKEPTDGDANGGVPSAGGSSTAGGGSTPEGGTPASTEGGTGGSAEPVDGVHIGRACTFHTDAPPADGAGGSGGEPAIPNVVAQLSPFVGSYLTDAAGRTLYTYGSDVPGDCEHTPQSGCIADCLVSWPIFDATARVLGPNLNDAKFGTFQRADGLAQATYMGWPLYYYKSDLTLGQMTGQGKGKTWHVAQVNEPAVTIMKTGMLKYLADADGHTLYVSAGDQVGSIDADPVSGCEGECLQTFEGFREKNFSIVGSLETRDFLVFARHDAGLQLAYKGWPLYRAATDVKAGDMNGLAIAGFTAAVP